MGQEYGGAQPIVDTLKSLEKYNPAEWFKSKPADDKSNTMNWKPEANDEQKAQIKRDQEAAKKPVLKKMPRKR